MKGNGEKRRSKRVNLDYALTDIHTKRVNHHKELRGKIYDISTVGVRLLSEQHYKVGSKIFLSLLLPNGASLSDIACDVLRCEQRENKAYHIAVAFKDLDFFQRSLVEDYIRLMELRNDF